jgi:hypothetical protein
MLRGIFQRGNNYLVRNIYQVSTSGIIPSEGMAKIHQKRAGSNLTFESAHPRWIGFRKKS